MKNFVLRLFLAIALIMYGLASCKNEVKQMNTKDQAIDKNNAQFKKTDSEKDEAAFLVDIAEMDFTAIELAQLADLRSTNEEIKRLSKMLIDDHKKSIDELQLLADNRQLSLPVSVTDKGKDQYNQLNDESGVSFDKKFLNMVIDDHEKAIKKMEDASTDDDKEESVKAWASNQIANLTAHLQEAKMINEKLYN
jgi:putative membrane protein